MPLDQPAQRDARDAGLDLDEADGRRIDLVVATKFPSYLVRHADKRVWLVHQFRQAYELDGTSLAQFDDSPEDRALRRKVQELDRVALGEASRLFAISGNVARASAEGVPSAFVQPLARCVGPYFSVIAADQRRLK